VTTFLDIATDALQRLGVYAPGEAISSADIAQAFTTYNDLADYLSNMNLACYANAEQSFVLVPGDGQYSIGPTGQIAQSRPLEILDNPNAARIVDGNGNVFPVDVIDQFAWNSISTQVVNSNLPEVVFYDPQFPNGLINLWPIPSAAYTFYFLSRLTISEAANLTSAISLPPGYNLMLKSQLAMRLLPYFGAQVTPQDRADIKAEARETLATIKRKNTKIPLAVFEKGLVKKGGSSPYNIYTDNR
jgi:hypothetical protein